MSEEISKSKQKRLAMKAEREKARKKKVFSTICYIAVPLLILAAVVAIVLYQRKLAEENRIDYSKYLADNGTIANINIDDYIAFDYQSMSFAKADLLPADEIVDADIDRLCVAYRSIPEADTAISKSGDTVNICYKASVDGVSYNEVTEASGGLDITIGDATFSEEFDQALIGHKKGDTFTTSVTYDAGYAVTELAGKTVTYNVTFNGIYVVPEFNDAFVQEHLVGQATTAAEYRVKITDEYYKSSAKSAIEESLSFNYVIKQLPEEYVANDAKILRKAYESQIQYYQQMLGYDISLKDYFQVATDEEVDAIIRSQAEEETELLLAYQYVFVHEGLTVTPEQVREYYMTHETMGIDYDAAVAEYGYNFIASKVMQEVALDRLVEITVK